MSSRCSVFIVAAARLAVASQPALSADKARVVRNGVLVHGAWADGSSWAKVIPIPGACASGQ